MWTARAQYRNNLLNFLRFKSRVVQNLLRTDLRFTRLMRTRRPRWFRQRMLEGAVTWAVNITLLVVDWKRFLLFWHLPHVYATWAVVTMNYVQHDGCDPESPYDHSRNFLGRLLNWLTLNHGYHTIHHNRPGLHWSDLPAAHAAEVAPFIRPELDQPSLIAYLWRAHLRGGGDRRTFDGRPIPRRTPAPECEDWVAPALGLLHEVSFGAESAEGAREPG